MSPMPADYYSAYCAGIYPKIISHLTLVKRSVGMLFLYLPNLIFCEYVVPVFFSMVKRYPSFSTAINHIFSTSSEEKMIQVCTRRIIAFVAHFHFWWNLPFKHRPNETMNFPMPSLVSALTISIASYGSTPLMARTNTASLNYIYMLKKVVSEFVISGWPPEYSLSVSILPNLIELVHGGDFTRCSCMFKS